jgi:hypothetical protein
VGTRPATPTRDHPTLAGTDTPIAANTRLRFDHRILGAPRARDAWLIREARLFDAELLCEELHLARTTAVLSVLGEHELHHDAPTRLHTWSARVDHHVLFGPGAARRDQRPLSFERNDAEPADRAGIPARQVAEARHIHARGACGLEERRAAADAHLMAIYRQLDLLHASHSSPFLSI